MRRKPLAALATLALLLALPRAAPAWPASLMERLARDARRLVPGSLGRLLAEREDKLFEEMRRFPPALGQALGRDLTSGRLQPQTLASLEQQLKGASELLRQGQVSDGLLRLGGALRIPADVSDPVLSAGPAGYPPGVVREYYSFVEQNLSKMPVVLDDASALKLGGGELARYYQGLLSRSREQSWVIREELFQRGRVVDHRTLDWHSPVFGVASTSYSRAVTAIAATWLALWRDAGGDTTRMPRPTEIHPRNQGARP